MKPQARVDHLVVAGASLADGIAWCRSTFGFEPAAGGAHPLMGTHNRIFRIDTPAFPRAYFEVIAIDPQAPHPGRTRWFDLDDPQLRAAIAKSPRLVHFVASTSDAGGAIAALAGQAIDRGPLLAAERPTPTGVLRWKISVRDDGQRLFSGALPTLIEWGDVHPCDSLPRVDIGLRSVQVQHPRAAELRSAYDAIGLAQVEVRAGDANLAAVLDSPRGPVTLASGGA